MPTTGPVKSRDIGIYIDDVLVGCSKSGTLNIERSTEDVTCDDSGSWDEVIPAQISWNMDVSGVVKYDNPVNVEEFFDSLVAGTAVVAKFSTEVSGDVFFSGSAFITNLTKSKNEGQAAATYDITLSGTGALSKANVV